MNAPATERDMLNLLSVRYNSVRDGTIADRWVRAEHVRSSQRTGMFMRIADFIAIDKYCGTQAMHGHEIKVSRSDWLTELRDLTKAEATAKYCDYFWLVVSDKSIVKDGELPAGWGLMVRSGDGLRAKVKPARRTPVPLTLDFIAGLTAAAARTAHREPLHRDARDVRRWTEEQGSFMQCQSCGSLSPCTIHQPRKGNHAQPPRTLAAAHRSPERGIITHAH